MFDPDPPPAPSPALPHLDRHKMGKGEQTNAKRAAAKNTEEDMLFDLWLRRGLLFDKDAGGGGGTDDSAGPAKAKEEPQKKADDPAKAKEEAGKEPPKAEEKKFTQAELEYQIEERLKRERKKADEAADKARKKAEEDTLAKNQEFQKLAEQRQTRVTELEGSLKELEPFKEQAGKYKAALEKQLKALAEKLPKYIIPLIEKMDPIEAMEYITQNSKELGAKLEPYSETPDGKQKTLTDDEKRDAKNAAARVIQKNF